jgi:hypothetical protein
VRARRVLILAAALVGVSLAAAAAGDDGLRIPNVETSFAGPDVRVEARLSPGLPKDVLKRLSSGLPTTAVWEVRLFASREKWWDGLKDERRYGVTATYRPVSGDYAVERRLDGRLMETVVVPEREEAAKALATLSGIPCFRMGRHLVGKKLVVRVRCLYGSEMALGVVPTRIATDWRRSPVFVWRGEGETP